uniref:EF-hand domain-containing protein n=1 Tax=Syphacia muris TaxID=451379 RepID=A0A0N5AVT1_9BILA
MFWLLIRKAFRCIKISAKVFLALLQKAFNSFLLNYLICFAELDQAFDALDTNKNGRLSRTELAQVFRAINVEPTRVEMDYIFKEMDTDGSGCISKDEFKRYMTQPPHYRTTVQELTRDFKMFDTDGDGAITLGIYHVSLIIFSITEIADELEKLLTKAAGFNDVNEIKKMFQVTDKNGDGRITFKEFVDMMKE